MNPEEKEKLDRTLELTEENNRMLKKMRSSMRWGQAWRIFYWAVIIILSLGAYYYIQPYISELTTAYGGLKQDFSNVNNVINSFKSPQQ